MTRDDYELRTLLPQRVDLPIDLAHRFLERRIVYSILCPWHRGGRDKITFALKDGGQFMNIAGGQSCFSVQQYNPEIIARCRSNVTDQGRDQAE